MAWIAPTFDYGYDEVQGSAMIQTSNFDQFHQPSTDSMRGDLSVTEIVIHIGSSNIMYYQKFKTLLFVGATERKDLVLFK